MLAPLGLRLSEEKSRVCHLDEGFDFLGFRIQRRRKKGTSEHDVYTYPSKKALPSIMAKVRALTKKSTSSRTSLTCSASSTRWCGDGVTISGTGVQSDVPLSRCLRLASGDPMAAQAAPRDQLEGLYGAVT